MKLSAAAKKLVDENPLKRSAIARECGIKESSLTQILNRHSNIGLPVLKHLARILKVSEQDLIEQESTSIAA